MSGFDTDALIHRAKRGDRSAEQHLLVKHEEKLKRMIACLLDSRLSSRVDVSDVLQDTMAVASQQLPSYLETQAVAFYPWLREIAKKRLIDIHRRHMHAQRRSVAREDHLDVHVSDASAVYLAERLMSRETSPSQQANQREMNDRIKEAMGSLPNPDRELVLMNFVEQMSIREISQILSVSETAARARLRRVIEKLSHSLFDGMRPDDF